MTQCDDQILSVGDELHLPTPEDLAEHPDVHFPQSYVSYRCDVLKEYKMLDESAPNKYRVRSRSEYEENSREYLSAENVRLDTSYPPAVWIKEDDIEILQDLNRSDGPLYFRDVGERISPWKASASFSRLNYFNLVSYTGIREVEMTNKGEEYFNSEFSTISVVREELPLHAKSVYYLGDCVLSLLDLLEIDRGPVSSSKSGVQIERAFIKAFWPRAPAYIFAGISILAFGLANPSDLQIYGLLMDIIGAIAVALGLFRGTRGIKVDTESTGAKLGGGLNTQSLESVVSSTIDGFFGTILLVGGFSLQFLSAASSQSGAQSQPIIEISVLVSIIFLAAAASLVIRFRIRN